MATAGKDIKQPKPLPAPNSDFYEVYETLNPRGVRDPEAGARVHEGQGRARHNST
jgi:hypothetical protein